MRHVVCSQKLHLCNHHSIRWQGLAEVQAWDQAVVLTSQMHNLHAFSSRIWLMKACSS